MRWLEVLPTPLLKLALLAGGLSVWYIQRKARALYRWGHASLTALQWIEPRKRQPFTPLTRGDQALADAMAFEIGKEGKRNAKAARAEAHRTA